MNTGIAAAAALLAALVPAGASQAAVGPHVTVTRSIRAIPLDAGYLVEVVCTARAHGAALTELPVVTTVTCAVEDYAQSQAAPGDVAVVTVTSAVTGPFALCTTAQAAFLDPVAGTAPVATHGPDCHTVHP